ncbi:MAG TPA: hypothetical protein PKC39_06110 [Ferruginibacter sp.]|nr:hypothetical protein [Ferruginibacter sp.]HMP20516.1 hypothetical protein [Ferruginibacter sp.]
MCTVSFVPLQHGVCITSNRDENIHRLPALPPAMYRHNNKPLWYPKDTAAAGSWFVCRPGGDCVVLLNGAFEKYIPAASYNKSRGLVLLDIALCINPVAAFENMPLQHIAPFTIIVFCKNTLYECRWDGENKYCKKLDAAVGHIWSSATLYTEAAQEKRKNWFSHALSQNMLNTQEAIMHFHTFTGDGDFANSLVMKRDNILQTLSITSAHITANGILLQHHDVVQQQGHVAVIPSELNAIETHA